MIQTRPQPSGALARTWNRGTRIPIASYVERLGAPFDWRRTLSLYRRLLSGDLSVLRDAARSETDTAPALAVMALGVLVASLGAWLWIVIDSRGTLIGDPALHVLFLGSIATLGLWGVWVQLTWHALRSIFQVEAQFLPLMRALAVAGGFAVWQFFMMAGPVSMAVALLTTMAGFLLSVLAVRAAVPEADDRAAVISVGIGFAVYALALSLLADVTGVGSGIFAHALG